MAAKKKTPAKKKPALKKKPVVKAARKAAPAKKAGATKKPAAKGKPRRPVRASKRPSPRRKVAAAKKPRAQAAKKAPLPAAPEAFALAKTIAQVAGDKKAENVVVIDTRSRSSAVGYDYLVLATGESDRQLSAIQEGVDELVKPQGKRPGSVEASADWVCVMWDEGVVAHFFTADRRELMDLEGLWAAAPRVTL